MMSTTTIDAKAIAHKQLSGDAVCEAMNPSRGIRDDIRRRGGEPRNHHRENLMRIRQKQQLNQLKERKEETDRLISDIQTTKSKLRFSHIPSKFKEIKSVEDAESDLMAKMDRLTITNDVPSRFPSANHVFVPPTKRKTKMGSIPKYLVERKEQWASERQSKAKIQQELIEGGGPGMIALPESERQQIIKGLQQKLDQTVKELNKMPIAIKTQAQNMRKKELEAKIESIEKNVDRMNRSGKIWIRKSQYEVDFLQQPYQYQETLADEAPVKLAPNPILGGAVQEVRVHSKKMQPSVHASVENSSGDDRDIEENILNWVSRRR